VHPRHALCTSPRSSHTTNTRNTRQQKHAHPRTFCATPKSHSSTTAQRTARSTRRRPAPQPPPTRPTHPHHPRNERRAPHAPGVLATLFATPHAPMGPPIANMRCCTSGIMVEPIMPWLVKVWPPGRVNCLLKQSCQECTHGYHGICTSQRVSTRAEHVFCVSTQRLLRGMCSTFPRSGFSWGFNWGSAIVLADHTRFSWANPTAGSLRHCLTGKTRHAPNTRRCPAPGPKTARELNPHTSLVCYSSCRTHPTD
jgi:hypothetical protein